MAGNIRYEIRHASRYRYTARVQHCTMMLCLQPRADDRQQLQHFKIESQPPARMTCETDYFGNTRHVFSTYHPHDMLEVTTHSVVEVTPPPLPPARLNVDGWKELRSLVPSPSDWQYTHPGVLTQPSPALTAFIDRHRIAPSRDPLEDLLQLSDTLYHGLQYLPGSTTVESTIEHVLETGSGVCQDYAHLMIAIARSWGIPARYVSGYLHVTDPSDAQAPGNATHAWVECRLPELGWTAFDPTNQGDVDQQYVRIAVGRDYHDISPTRGVLRGGGETRLEVDVRMSADQV